MNTFKITCNTGKTWVTGFNGDMQAAKRYFLNHDFTDELDDGTEIHNTCILVEQV